MLRGIAFARLPATAQAFTEIVLIRLRQRLINITQAAVADRFEALHRIETDNAVERQGDNQRIRRRGSVRRRRNAK
nr:hypothetical protein [Candidatus Pantoea persica]